MDSSSEQKFLFGPYFFTSFDQKLWKTIQTKLSKFDLASCQNELFSECLQYSQLLQGLNSSSNIENCFGDASIKTFFFNKLIPKITKNILKCNTINNVKMAEILKQCLRQVVLLWAKTLLEDHIELTKVVERVLRMAYLYYGCTEFSSTTITPEINHNNRPNPKSFPRSTLFDDLIESIHKEKLLGWLYEIVNDPTRWSQSIKMMTLVCSAVANLSLVFPKDLVIKCMSKVRENTKEQLVHNCRSHVESFKEQNPISLLRAYNLLLRKLSLTALEKHREIDLLKLQICSTCFKSKIFHSRVIGLRILNQVLADLKSPHLTQLKVLSKSECDQVLLKMFDEVFCGEVKWKPYLFPLRLLEYLIQQNLLTSENYKALKIALTLFMKQTNPIMENIIDKAQDTRPYMIILDCIITSSISNFESFNYEFIELFRMILELTRGSKEIKQRLEYFYNELLKSDTTTNPEILYKMLRHFPERDSIEYALSTMSNCIDQLEKDITSLPLFRTISFIVYQYAGYSYGWYDIEQQKIIQIIEDRSVLELFMTHLKSFKQRHRPDRVMSARGKAYRKLYLAQISARIDCLDYLLKYHINRQSLSYETLSELWEICIEQAFIPAERDLMFKLLASLAEVPASHECISLNDLQKFLIEKIIHNERKYDLLNSKEGAHCFHSFFVAGNQISGGIRRGFDTDFIVIVHPTNLKGFDTLWNFALRCEAEDALNFLVKLYTSLDNRLEADLVTIREECVARCFKCLKEVLARQELKDKKKYLRCLRLIGAMMDESEKNGLGNMNIHTQLARSEKLKLNIEYGYLTDIYSYLITHESILHELTITVDSNITVFEFFKKVSLELKLHWDELQLFKYPNFMPNSKDIPRNYTGRTLSDIGIRTDTRLRIFQQYIPKVDLLLSDNTFDPRAEKFLTSLFKEYSDNGKMSPEHYRDYLDPYDIDVDNYRIQDFFESQDLDRKGFLTLNQFLKCNLRVCQYDPDSVWSDFERHHKRHDLKEAAEIDNYKANESSLMPYIISSNDIYLDILFSLLDYEEDTIAQEAWNLRNRMPTNLKIFEEIVLMTGVRGIADPSQRDWNSVFNMNSKYKALYAINIVEYLFYPNQNKEKSVLIEIPRLSEYQKTWEKDFLGHGGLEHLCHIFNLFKPSERTVFTSPYKRVFDFSDAIIDKFSSLSENILNMDEIIKSQISRLLNAVFEYQTMYLSMRQNVNSRLVRKAVDRLKRGVLIF